MGFISRSSKEPVGEIKFFGNASIPASYLPADGAAVSRTTFAQLFAEIGIAYGAGNGTTTFNVPDYRGRAPIGDGTGSGLTARTRGTNVGTETHPLSIGEIAAHDHGGGSHQHNTFIDTGAGGGTQSIGFGGVGSYPLRTPLQAPAMSGPLSTVVVSQGSGTAHNNMQPSLPSKFGIKF